MENYGARIGFVLLALPLFLIVGWLGWDERIAHAGVGFLGACALAGQDLDEDPFEPPLGFYVALAISAAVGSFISALVVQNLADRPVGLYELVKFESDWKAIKAMPVLPVALASFSLTMFAIYFAARHQMRSFSDR